MKKYLYYYLPVAMWMTVIFALSSRHKVSVSEEYILNFLFFKMLHVIEYTFLFTLWFRAFLFGSKNKAKTKHTLKIAIVASLLYAISDEFHQTFVPSRQGTLRDVFIDLIGITGMYVYMYRNYWFVKRFLL